MANLLLHAFSLTTAKTNGDASPTRTQSPGRASPRPKLSTSSSSSTNVATAGSIKDRIARFQSSPHLPPISPALAEKSMHDVARSPSPLSPISRTASNRSPSHPDLSDEVAALSAKLVKSLNRQTMMDDTLQETRHNLEIAHEKIAQLESAAKEHARRIKQGLLIRKEHVDYMELQLRREIKAESDAKVAVEEQKKRIELELETLTQSLFEEANGMVAQARKEQEMSERKTDSLRHQLNDAELLLASHQEQLHDLKGRFEQLQVEQDLAETLAAQPSAPGTPRHAASDNSAQPIEPNAAFQIDPKAADPTADHPLSFSSLIHPIFRTDLHVYDEFLTLLMISKTPATGRAQSGTFGGLNVMGLGSLGGNKEGKDAKQSPQTTAISNSSLSASSPGSPVTTSESTQEAVASLASLKEAKFYKRALVEDIEPTLRLDLAPGLSWLARRTVLNSMTIGSLVVEPFPQPSRVYGAAFACAMCGEVRRTEKYARRHRFRASEAEDAQRYPLCDYCVARVRSSCDYIGFLRMVKNGHWRSDTDEEKAAAWEESVRLRERMFWARVGGGVVPAFSHHASTSAAALRSGASTPKRRTVIGQSPTSKSAQTDEEKDSSRPSYEETSSEHEAANGLNPPVDEPVDEAAPPLTTEEGRIEAEAAEQLRQNVQASIALKRSSRADLLSTATADEASTSKEESTGSAMPGAFE